MHPAGIVLGVMSCASIVSSTLSVLRALNRPKTISVGRLPSTRMTSLSGHSPTFFELA